MVPIYKNHIDTVKISINKGIAIDCFVENICHEGLYNAKCSVETVNDFYYKKTELPLNNSF